MKHNIPKYLEDVLISIADINNYIRDIESVIQLEENQLVFDAVY